MRLFEHQGRALLIAAAVMVGSVFASYGQTRPAELVGQWENEYGHALELFKDGRGFFSYPNGNSGKISQKISWRTEGTLFVLTYESGDESGYEIGGSDYKLSGYEFSYTAHGEMGDSYVIWVRKGKLEEYKKKKAEEEKRRAEELRKNAVETKMAAEQKFANISSYFTDPRDGQKYRTVNIGGKTWMAQNLNYRTERRSCCYNNDYSYCEAYGRLYDWNTAKTACPSGWRLPSREEWVALGGAVAVRVVVAKGSYVDWGTVNEILKSSSGWNGNGNGTDKYGFTALPGGVRNLDGSFKDAGSFGFWWSATEEDGERFEDSERIKGRYAYYGGMCSFDDDLNIYSKITDMGFTYEGEGHSVRCIFGEEAALKAEMEAEEAKKKAEREAEEVKRKAEEAKKIAENAKTESEQRLRNISGYFTDPRDGQKYRTVTIGGKMWMAQNLNYQKGMSWCYDDNNSYCGKYGRLYDWPAAKKACPKGWHLPSREEWNALVSAAGGNIADESQVSTSGWSNRTVTYGFSALPGGFRSYVQNVRNGMYVDDGTFQDVGKRGLWWTAYSKTLSGKAYYRNVNFDGYSGVGEYNVDVTYGLSVRCIAD
ncbi:hypothetical protein R80B4_00301 [Fibrobacteres bacterium R8-0-B4]